MCNLSQGIREAGIAEGMERGMQKVVLNMHNNGFTLEQIMTATGMDAERIRAVIGREF